MKISFQILHNYTENTLKIIANALHSTLQDDLLFEIDLRTAIDFITPGIESTLKNGVTISSFALDIDTYIYDFSKYDDFIEGFKGRLKVTTGFISLLKYIDNIRTEEYIKSYRELADLEMKMREVFSFIFYNKYDPVGSDLFEEFDAKTVGAEPSIEELEKRLENKFFYLTFSGYLKFEKPKDVQIKELVPLIQNIELYEQLRIYLSSRGITKESHVAFLQSVRTTLDPIESVRNCIAHNRQIPNKTEANYEKAKKELFKFIDDFWESELQKNELDHDIAPEEKHAFERINDLLSVSEWNEYNNEVVVHDHWAHGTPAYGFKSLKQLESYLMLEADRITNANAPSALIERKEYEESYDGKTLIDKILKKYSKELIILNWI
jgi:hypothetical protein